MLCVVLLKSGVKKTMIATLMHFKIPLLKLVLNKMIPVSCHISDPAIANNDTYVTTIQRVKYPEKLGFDFDKNLNI